jgi:hypothetical protein
MVDLNATLVGRSAFRDGGRAADVQARVRLRGAAGVVDHGPDGTGECLAAMLRPGKANANDAANHIAVLTDALTQLPAQVDRSRVVVRGARGAGTHEVVPALVKLEVAVPRLTPAVS